MTEQLEKSGRQRGRRPLEASEAALEKAALRYLERYAAPAAHLRRILMTKVERSARFHGTDRAEGGRQADRVVAKLTAAGLLDDRAYAAAVTRSQHRRGASARAIRAKLAAKGVAPGLIEEALAARQEEAGDPELAAAVAYIRRRRLGPYRAPDRREGLRDRDLAVLARAGFSYDIARQVVEAPEPADLEASLAEGPS